jgi:ATP-dependent Clp protease, protease subunit
MTDVHGIWPDIPPEVPPPRRPDAPPDPERTPAAPWVPVVWPAAPGIGGERDLLTHRIVLALGALDHDLATRVAAEIMMLDAEGGDPITLHLAAHDGALLSALMVAETISLAASPVVAVAKGVVGGVALAPFAAADRRSASPHVTFRMTEPRLDVSGVASELTAGVQEFERQVKRFHRWIADATGQPESTIAQDMRRGRILDAEAALAYGLVHEIVTGPPR